MRVMTEDGRLAFKIDQLTSISVEEERLRNVDMLNFVGMSCHDQAGCRFPTLDALQAPPAGCRPTSRL